MPEPRAERRVKVERKPRLGGLWLVVFCLALASGSLHYQGYIDRQTLQQQLVATQENFARLGEESMDHLQVLEARTSGIAELQGRAQGLVVQQKELHKKLDALQDALQKVFGLSSGQDQLATSLLTLETELKEQLDTQSRAVEQAVLLLGEAHATLQEELLDSQQKLEEQQQQSGLLEQEIAALADQLANDREGLHKLRESLSEVQRTGQNLSDLPERFASLQESVLTLAQKQSNQDAKLEELLQELIAFRLQVTRTQNQLQERLNAGE